MAKTKSNKKGDRPLRMTAIEKQDIAERLAKGESPPQIAEAIGRSYITVLKYAKSQGSGGRSVRARQGQSPEFRLEAAQQRFDDALKDLLKAQGEVAIEVLKRRLSELV